MSTRKRPRRGGDGSDDDDGDGKWGSSPEPKAKRTSSKPTISNTLRGEAKDPTDPDLVQRVRDYMSSNRVSQSAVGSEARVSQAVISQWLSLKYHGHNEKVDEVMRDWLHRRLTGRAMDPEMDEKTSILRPARSTTLREKLQGILPGSSQAGGGGAAYNGPPVQAELLIKARKKQQDALDKLASQANGVDQHDEEDDDEADDDDSQIV